MLRILAIILPFIFLTGCDLLNSENQVEVNSLNDVLTYMSPAEQVFESKPDEETVIKGNEGTSIYIPPNSFQFPDGTVPSGKVEIKLKEFYSTTNILGADLHTMSGDRLLETGGMIEITAFADGRELELQKGSVFGIGIPKTDANKEMDLFYDANPSDSILDWVVDYQMNPVELEPIESETNITPEEAETVMATGLYDFFLRPCWFNSVLKEVRIAATGQPLFDYVKDSMVVESRAISEIFRNNWHIHYTIKIDDSGKIVSATMQNDIELASEYCVEALKNAIESLPVLDLTSCEPAIIPNRLYTLGFQAIPSFSEGRYKGKYREQFKEFIATATPKLGVEELHTYVFASSQLGLINCDRFYDIQEENKTDLLVRSSFNNDLKVYLVFDEIRSIMQGQVIGGEIAFERVPKGYKVKVIGISHSDGKPVMAKVQTTIGDDEIELMAFEPFTLDELDQQLN